MSESELSQHPFCDKDLVKIADRHSTSPTKPMVYKQPPISRSGPRQALGEIPIPPDGNGEWKRQRAG